MFYRDFRIVKQDGTGGTPNPPVNLYGTHLRAAGNFKVHVTLSGVRGGAAMTLYGAPPLIYDEFRVDRGSLRLEVRRGHAHLALVGPHSRQRRIVDRGISLRKGSTHSLTFRVRRHGSNRRAAVFIDGRRIAGFDDAGTFASGEAWLGFDEEGRGSSFLVRRLSARGVEPIDTSPLLASGQVSDGLNQLAQARRPGFRIGAAMSLAPLTSDKPFADLALSGQFGAISIENALKPQFVHPQRHTYDFSEGDALVDIAERNGLTVHGHALAFGEANPRWMQRLARRHPGQMRSVLRDHVTRIVHHYRGRVASWDVVNEPLADYGDPAGPHGLRRNLWLKSIGPDYLAVALRAARAADPHAQLFINEFGLEAGDHRWHTMQRLIEWLQRKHVPVDGVGLQSHVYEVGDEIDPQQLGDVFQDLRQLGLKARISELDVHADRGRRRQAQQFATILGACLQASNCESLTFWGVSERYGSTSYLDHGKLRIGQGLPWNRHLQPLPAVAAMRRVLSLDPSGSDVITVGAGAGAPSRGS